MAEPRIYLEPFSAIRNPKSAIRNPKCSFTATPCAGPLSSPLSPDGALRPPLLHAFPGLEVVQQIRIAVHGQPGRVAAAAVVGAMPHLSGHEHDVALQRVEDRKVADLVVDGAFEDEPEL